MELVRSFTSLTKSDSHMAGGKGASLGEMTQAGIPVPPGFVVLSNSFERFIHETNLVEEIDAILEKVDHKEIHTVEKASEDIKALILNAKMPADIAEEVMAEFKKLDTTYVAVRSSATAEDGMDHAWAGQLESYLNTTEANLLDKVKHCWASLFTPRAIFYRFEKELHTTKISVAVVVQKMVESEVSGIAFSVHPVTEDYNQLIIEAGFGLGEAIVSGSVTPDSYVVEKEPRKVIDINISTQGRGLYRVEGGGNEWKGIPEPKASSQVLNEAQILELSKVILNIEKHYGFPCDIEWAYEKGKFCIVQSRPITTLSKKASRPDQANTSDSAEDEVRHFIEKYRIHPPFIQKATPVHFYTVDFVQCYWKIWGDYSGSYYRLYLFVIRNQYVDVYYLADSFAEMRAHYFAELEKDKKYLDKHYKDWSKSCSELEESIHSFEKALLAGKFPETFAAYKKFAEDYIYEYGLSGTIQEACGFQPELWIDPEIAAYCKQHDLDVQQTSALLVSPIVLSFVAEEEAELLELALVQRKGNQKKFEKALADHQAKWFWLRNNYITIEALPEPFFKDRIEKLKDKNESWLKGEIERIRTSPEIKQKEKEVLFKKFKPSDKLRLYVKVAETFADMQDVRKSYVLRANHYHKLFLETVAREFNKPIEDLWFYSYKEMMKALESGNFLDKSLIEERKDIIVAGESKDEKFILTGASAEALAAHLEKESANTKELKGSVAQPGKVQGTVKVVLKVGDIDKVDDGDILVSSMTRPEMTGAMQKAAAFVTDEGGITCHAAIISRELKKPCIIGTKVATKVLKDGDMVEVDANKGIVTLIK